MRGSPGRSDDLMLVEILILVLVIGVLAAFALVGVASSRGLAAETPSTEEVITPR